MTGARALVRSTPLRLALMLAGLFTLVNLVTLGGAYLQLRAASLSQIRVSVEAEMAGFDVTATPAALATLVRARARAADPAASVYVFLGDDGRRAGNAEAVLRDGRPRLAPLPGGRRLSGAGYLHEVRRLSSGVLIVAQSLAPLSALRRTFLTLLALSVGPTALLSVGLGTLIARRSARRVARIEAVLGRLETGELSARYDAATDHADDDLAHIGRRVNRMAAQQEAATEALRQVSADIAHDLRTPLQRISVLLSDLRDNTADGSEAARIADAARAEADRANAVFRALLEIAQIEGGGPAARFAPVDLAEVAREIVELYEPAAEEAGVTLAADLSEAPATVSGARDLIAQALANLIENALRHAGRGARTTVAVRGGTGAASELVVTDTGPGIPAGERDRVLRRLYRLERSRTTPGNGLGLSLVAAIAHAHGAKLTLGDASPGLSVRLRFPAAGD